MNGHIVNIMTKTGILHILKEHVKGIRIHPDAMFRVTSLGEKYDPRNTKHIEFFIQILKRANRERRARNGKRINSKDILNVFRTIEWSPHTNPFRRRRITKAVPKIVKRSSSSRSKRKSKTRSKRKSKRKSKTRSKRKSKRKSKHKSKRKSKTRSKRKSKRKSKTRSKRKSKRKSKTRSKRKSKRKSKTRSKRKSKTRSKRKSKRKSKTRSKQ